MLYPPIDQLLEKVDSRFTLVTLVTKRAHQINNKAPILIEHPRSLKPVSAAMEEVFSSKIRAKRPKDKAA